MKNKTAIDKMNEARTFCNPAFFLPYSVLFPNLSKTQNLSLFKHRKEFFSIFY